MLLSLLSLTILTVIVTALAGLGLFLLLKAWQERQRRLRPIPVRSRHNA